MIGASIIAQQSGYNVPRQFLWISLGRVIAALLQAALLVLLVRAIPPAEFGFVSAALGLIVVVQVGLDFGLPTLAARERASNQTSRLVWAALRLNALTSLAIAAVLVGIGLAISMWTPLAVAMLPLAISAAAERVADARLGIVIADGDAVINTAVLVARRAFAVPTFFFFEALTASSAVLSFSLALATAAATSAVLAQLATARRIPRAVATPALQVFRDARPYWVNSLATQMRNLDSTFATIVGGPLTGGYYGAAARLTSPLRLPASSLGAALLPAATRARSDRALNSIFTIVAASSAIFFLFYLSIGLLVPTLVPVALGTNYVGATLAIQILAFGMPFAATASMLTSVLQGMGAKRVVAIIATWCTVACLGGVALGSIFGAAYAAIGLSASFVLNAALLAVAIRKARALWRTEREGEHDDA